MKKKLLNKNKICLGTVKLGIPDYGFSSENTDEQFDSDIFLKSVLEFGIKKLDISPRYGNAEEIIGLFHKNSKNKFSVNSKIDDLVPNDKNSIHKIVDSVTASIDKLGIEKLDICYLHQNEIEIISDTYILESLLILKERKLINKIGVSVYSHEECNYAINSNYFDSIQIPVNIVDMSFYDTFVKNNNTSIEFIARSIFLQGILLNDFSTLALKNGFLHNYINELKLLFKQNEISILDVIKSLLFSLDEIDQFILGSTNLKNIRLILEENTINIGEELKNSLFKMAKSYKPWANPRNWKY